METKLACISYITPAFRVPVHGRSHTQRDFPKGAANILKFLENWF